MTLPLSLIMSAATSGAAEIAGSVAELDERSQLFAFDDRPTVDLAIPRAIDERWFVEHFCSWLCRTLNHPASLTMFRVECHFELCRFESTENDEVKVDLQFNNFRD